MTDSTVDFREGDRTRVNILEVGPRGLPSTEFFNEHPGASIVFVANESFEKYSKDLPPDANFVQSDITDYLQSDHPSIPKAGFDFILMVGVFSQPPTRQEEMSGRNLPRRLDEFIGAARNRLSDGGQLIIEDHYLGREVKILSGHLAEKLRTHGFDVVVSKDKESFLQKNLAHPDSFNLKATKV